MFLFELALVDIKVKVILLEDGKYFVDYFLVAL